MLTYREFYEICEGKKSTDPPHAVPGSVKDLGDGARTYTLQSYTGPSGPPSKKEIEKTVISKSGGKEVKKYVKARDKKKKNP
jgi:hypothetical protein